ncbi:hypothetical protein ACVIHH_008039 [Bradyrhizobium sp. USDA 4518]
MFGVPILANREVEQRRRYPVLRGHVAAELGNRRQDFKGHKIASSWTTAAGSCAHSQISAFC